MKYGKETDALLQKVTFPHPHAEEVKDPRIVNESKLLLKYLGVDLTDANFRDTPSRFVDYLKDHFISREKVDLALDDCANAVFPTAYDGIVSVRQGEATGICPHHLLPILYTFSVAYIPNYKTIGISKLVRIPQIILNLPGLQEDLTKLAVNVLYDILHTPDIALTVSGVHMCMVGRGVKARDADTITSSMRGAFLEEGPARQEFFSLIK